MDQLSLRQFRHFLLLRQGLWPPRSVRGPEGILTVFRRLRCVQYDSIDLIGRNHDLVLQSRVAGYRRSQLWQLLYNDRLLTDGWDKQMSIGLLEEKKYFASERFGFQRHGRFQEDGPLQDVFPLIRREISRRGPLSSLDIDSDLKADWSWAPTRAVRAAMEALWFRGELSIHHREGSRRFYDFTHQLVPQEYRDESVPETFIHNPDTILQWRIERRIASAGALKAGAGDGWLGIDAKTGHRRKMISEMLENGRLVAMEIEGFKEVVYRLNDDTELYRSTLSGETPVPKASVIAPLDNLIWDRKLIQKAFGFDYVWEVYKPAKDRRWGYYVLPILYGDRFIARIEPGRDRKTGSLVIKKCWTEKGIRVSKAMASATGIALKALATADGLKQIRYTDSDDPLLIELKKMQAK